MLELDARGVRFMLTNSDTPFTRALYSRWDIRTMQAARSINSDPTKRGSVSELIVRNYT
jgi:DNA adenine methylase